MIPVLRGSSTNRTIALSLFFCYAVDDRLVKGNFTVNTLFRIRYTLNDQNRLRDIGPLIPASWGATPKDTPTTNPTAGNQNIQGNVLFDTGAGGIGIDESVAERLGLQPLSKRKKTCRDSEGSIPLTCTTQLYFFRWNLLGPSVEYLWGRTI
jgi:hypothetical protein